VFDKVGDAISKFKQSLPLISDLKNDALRERHWKKLMKVTGKSFDLDPKSFTLGKVFQMNLAEFGDMIGEITNEAIKV
jgi:dynein heavy chain, axonemal